MKIYKNAIIATSIVTLISFLWSFIFNFCMQIDLFWCNALLGVFGSSLLTLLTSIIGYKVERRQSFEGFYRTTTEILHVLNKYQVPWDLDKKVDFLLYYHDISKAEWSRYYGGFSFIADFHGKNRCYIYEKICAPILSLNKSIDYYSINLRDYIDSSYKNKDAIGTIVKEIESLFIETTFSEINDNCVTKPIAIPFTRNKTVHTIKKELNGEYYKLMYGKRVYNQSHPNS